MWWFWEQFHAIESTAQLGGIFADKPGYHNTRNGNAAGNYSITSTLDKQGPGDKAAAIDITFPDAQSARYATIAKYASRLLRSGQDPADERGNYLREFYGQTDSDTAVEGWDFQALISVTSDTSHLWHIHISVIRAYLDNWKAFRALLSILSGQTVEAWRAAEAGNAPTPIKGDDMANVNQDDWDALIWRNEAVINNRAVVIGGPTAGEVNKLAVALASAAGTPITPEQLAELVAAAKAGAEAGVGHALDGATVTTTIHPAA